MMHKSQIIIFLGILFLSHSIALAEFPANSVDEKLLNWLKSNISSETGLPYSFYIREENKAQVFGAIGGDNAANVIERVILNEGLIIYDGAISQIALALSGEEEALKLSSRPVEIYWEGGVKDFYSIRAGYPHNLFIYDPIRLEEEVSSVKANKGKRGFIYRIINADGRYATVDPLDETSQNSDVPAASRFHWQDWKPMAGENAWVTIASLQVFHKKYFDSFLGGYLYPSGKADEEKPIELLLAEELARVALFLQAENGGIRMAPINTYREILPGETASEAKSWWYNQISTENNISWYAAFRMLYDITGDDSYAQAMRGIEEYLRSVYNPDGKYFYQSMRYDGEQWVLNQGHFALDVQTWGTACLGPEKIDEWFGEGTSFIILQNALKESGSFDEMGNILGVGFTTEHDRISVEWTAGAILALREVGQYYEISNPSWSEWAMEQADSMRQGIEFLRQEIGEDKAAYAYSSKRAWIPFGWYSHDPNVLSTASTGWVIFNDLNFNPFYLPQEVLPEVALK